jgi:hypothetical protein
MSIPIEDLVSYLQQKAPSIQRQPTINQEQSASMPLPVSKPLLIKSYDSSPMLYDINKNYASPEQMEENGRDWTYEHIRTLIYWMNIANINIFLLDASIQHYKKIVMQVMAFTFLFSSLSTTISLSQLGIDEEKNPGLANGIKYTFVVASTISTILVGYVKLFKLQEMMDADIEMHKDWLEFATKISGELQMPKRLRTPALKLLQDMKDSYIGLFCKRPFVPGMVKRYANRYFMNYTQNAIEERSCLCCARHNYIKRTNIFFVFQDIMKNEIKRLAAEIEVDNRVINENEQPFIDGPLAAGTELGRPKLPTSSELKQNITIQYIYDGPFISIEVINKEAPKSMVKNSGSRRDIFDDAAISMAPYYRRQPVRERKSEGGRQTLFKAARRKLKNIGGGGGVISETESDGSIEEYRPRAASFQAPERALYTQMQYRTAEASPSTFGARGSEMVNKKGPSFALKQKHEIDELVKQINQEIVTNHRKSVVATHIPMVSSSATTGINNADVNYENINRLFPMATENDGSSVESVSSSVKSGEDISQSTDSQEHQESRSLDSPSKQ